jgi:predicted nucleotidyltransferase
VTQFAELVRTLSLSGIDFIIVGGVAAAAHGSPRATQDIDVVYSRAPDNLSRIAEALQRYDAYLRGAPRGLPFRLDAATLAAGLNFTLTTSLGLIDLLGEITGGGRYEDLFPHSIHITIFGVSCRVLDLDTLIDVKRAAGRPKDFEVIAELELLRDRRR